MSVLPLFKNKKILITGHTGFKGSWLSLWLINQGAKVFGISNGIPTQPSLFETLNLSSSIEHLLFDIRKSERLKKEIERIKPDFVFHMAAQSIVSLSYKDPLETVSTNVIGTANLLEALTHIDKKCVSIIITSDKCYKNKEWIWGYREIDELGGKDIYSGSKAAAEVIFNSFFHSLYNKKLPNNRLATGRAGNVIGGGDWAMDRIVPDCIRAWSNNEKVQIRNPEATRPWLYVLDSLSGYITLAHKLWQDNKFNGESFNFCPQAENNVSVRDLIKMLSANWGFKEPDDSYIITGSRFKESGLLKLNCDKALSLLNWNPILNLQESVEFTNEWYLKFYNTKMNMLDFSIQQIKQYENKAAQMKIEWAIK